MDPFTQKMLERTKARRELLNAKKIQAGETPMPLPRTSRSPLKEKNMFAALDVDKEFSSPLGTRYSPRKIDAEPTFSIRKTNVPDTHLTERSPTSAKEERSNRLAALAAQINTWEDESMPATTSVARSAVTPSKDTTGRRSGQSPSLRKDTASPRASPRSNVPTPPPPPPVSAVRASPRKSIGDRASVVAVTRKVSTSSSPTSKITPVKATDSDRKDTINRRSVTTGSSNSLPRQVAPTSAKPSPRRSASTASPSQPTPTPFAQATPQRIAGDSVRRTMVWDQAIVAALEAQGYSKSPSKSKLEYKFKKGMQKELNYDDSQNDSNRSEEEEEDDDEESSVDSDSEPDTVLDESCGRVIEPPKKSVRELAQRFKGDAPRAREETAARDPALLPLSARVALFEKEAKTSASSAGLAGNKSKRTLVVDSSRRSVIAADSPSKSPPRKKAGSPATSNNNSAAAPPAASSSVSPSKVGRHTFQIHRQLFENASSQWRENEISAKIHDERKRDMEVVLNRWNRPPAKPNQSVVAPGGKSQTATAATALKKTTSSVTPKKATASVTPKKVATSGAPKQVVSSVTPKKVTPVTPNKAKVDTTPTRKISTSSALTYEKIGSGKSVTKSPAKRIPTPPPLPPPASIMTPTRVVQEFNDYDSQSERDDQDSSHSEHENEEGFVSDSTNDWPENSEDISDQSVVDEEADECEDDVQDAVDAVDRAFPDYKDVDTSEDGLDEEPSDIDDDDQVGSGEAGNIDPRGAIKPSYDSELDSSMAQAVFKRIQCHSMLPPSSGKMMQDNPPKRTRMSPPVAVLQTQSRSLQKVQSSSEEYASDDSGPLLHTVSFYRRQQETLRLTPVKTIVRRPQLVSPPLSPEEPAALPPLDLKAFQKLIQNKLKSLQEEVNAQQIIISQTSQAVNHCRATPEFYGSAEQVEGERLLLIATQRRQCCLAEIERLKTEAALAGSTQPPPLSKGSLTIGEIKLPLKREFLQQTANGSTGEFVHFFVCLLKHRAQVIATQMVSTADGISAGAFFLPNLINLHELDHSFNVMLEVYGLQTKRENIVRDKRTLASSKKEKSRLTLTPRSKLNKRDSRSSVQSPGGPYMVCTSSFSLIGATALNIKTLQRPSWVLDKVPFVSPLEGNVFMKVQCHTDAVTEEKGFMTMFEDVSGFGAWHRRWFVLSRRYLSYWKYPDDVKNKEPIGRVDLRQCVTANVGLVPRDICARPHTVMLMTVRAPAKDDANSLVQHNYNSYTAIKVLLSADTKEERVLWSKNLNRALESLRTWDPNALRPMPREPTLTS